MKTFILKNFILLVLFCHQYCIAQFAIPEIDELDIPNGEILRIEYFEGGALYGHINGGADLFLEYGFYKLLVQEILWHKHHFKINVYQMNDEEAAFGIFSIFRRGSSPSDSLSKFCSYTPHQIQIAHGELYIAIANDNGTVEEQLLTRELAQIILSKVEKNNFQLPKLFTSDVYSPYLSNLKYIRGKIGLQNGFPAWENLFEHSKFLSLYILPISMQEGEAIFALVHFENEKEKENFYKNLNIMPDPKRKFTSRTTNSYTKAVKEISSTQVIYLESSLSQKVLSRFLKPIENAKK